MKFMRIFTKSLIIVLSLFLSCGSLKTTRMKEKNVEAKVNLPPNVSSNKYSKKRIFNNQKYITDTPPKWRVFLLHQWT